MINVCVECGKEFEHRRLAKVCKECQEKPMACPICGTEFVRKSTNQTCCCSDCTKQYRKIKPKAPKKPKIDMEDANEVIGGQFDMIVKEFDTKPKAGTMVTEECENCGAKTFMFTTTGNDKKGTMEYICTARGCGYSHIFKWGHESEPTEETPIEEE